MLVFPVAAVAALVSLVAVQGHAGDDDAFYSVSVQAQTIGEH